MRIKSPTTSLSVLAQSPCERRSVRDRDCRWTLSSAGESALSLTQHSHTLHRPQCPRQDDWQGFRRVASAASEPSQHAGAHRAPSAAAVPPVCRWRIFPRILVSHSCQIRAELLLIRASVTCSSGNVPNSTHPELQSFVIDSICKGLYVREKRGRS